MKVIVVGGGRSGTNMALEMLRASGQFKASEPPENKTIFKQGTFLYGSNYLTKCDTFYIDINSLNSSLLKDKNIKIVFTIRDPRDMAMSKLYRGLPFEKGGDCPELSYDATPDRCIETLYHMMFIYDFLMKNFWSVTKLIKMEDIILKTKNVVEDLCKWIGIEFNPEMCHFYNYMRNISKSKRYNEIDKSQIQMWKKWKTVYGGYLNNFNMEEIFKEIKPITEEFKYEKA